MSRSSPLLNLSRLVFKQSINFWMTRLSNEILHPETGEVIGSMRTVRTWKESLQGYFLGYQHAPKTFEIYSRGTDEEEKLLLRLKRGFVFIHQEVTIEDRRGRVIGHLKSPKEFSRTEFVIWDEDENFVARLKGDWKQRRFQFLDEADNIIGELHDQWEGLSREMFSGDNFYSLAYDAEAVPDKRSRALLLAGCAGYWYFFKVRS